MPYLARLLHVERATSHRPRYRWRTERRGPVHSQCIDHRIGFMFANYPRLDEILGDHGKPISAAFTGGRIEGVVVTLVVDDNAEQVFYR